MSKPILCLDFDGVIHEYISGWKGADRVDDPPVDGAIEFIVAASQHFTIAIFSSRTHQKGGLDAMKNWLRIHWLDYGFTKPEQWDVYLNIQWPVVKPAAFLTIDDRAMTFTGVWPNAEELTKFKPWNKK